MNILSIAVILFLILETLNITLLYFAPSSTKGNGMGFFKAFEKSKSDPEVHALVRYLVNWVAGTKLIFIALLVVVLITGDDVTKLWSVIVLIPSIAVFYWRMYPAIKKMDAENWLTTKGYSRTLGIMIAVFLAVFVIALVISLL